ncbi:MAG: DUF3160 domain-containing protein, partial [Acidimicrobiia bacterium]
MIDQSKESALRRTSVLIVVVALLTGACVTQNEEPTSTTTTSAATSTTPSTVPTTTGTTLPGAAAYGLRQVPAFADFPEIPLLGNDPPYAGPTTPTSLDGVLWSDQVPDQARDLLAGNGFVVLPGGYGQFHEAYSNVELNASQPLFVTTDAAYHYWHLAFAKALRDTEQLVLLPILEQFTLTLNQVAEADAGALQGTSMGVEAEHVARYSELLLALLELKDGPYSPEVESELTLITDHAAFESSPTTGAMVDYSLFGVRGHYTRTPELTRYFLAMSSLGQTAFLLDQNDQVRTGLMLARAITGNQDLSEMWAQIYEPTAFLVGLADDFTPLELATAADTVDGNWRESPEVIDDAFVAGVVAELNASRSVAIDPERASMRVMGARFVLDSFILDQLIYPNVAKYDDNGVPVGRFEGSPLDVAAAFGSDWAYQRQVQAGVPEDYPDYDPQLAKMSELVSERVGEDWAGTVYDGWLYAIQPMWNPHGAVYPDFMQTDTWAAKDHNTGFGSYVELKHDTLLYAKQAFAEGETPTPPAEPRHWVEPEPVVYARLAAVANLMRQGLDHRGLLAPDVEEILARLGDMYDTFERLARDELAGSPISDTDNQWLESIGSRFELIWLLASEDVDESAAQTGGFSEAPDDISAVIADIMSNPDEA